MRQPSALVLHQRVARSLHPAPQPRCIEVIIIHQAGKDAGRRGARLDHIAGRRRCDVACEKGGASELGHLVAMKDVRVALVAMSRSITVGYTGHKKASGGGTPGRVVSPRRSLNPH
jgi:hypothetical protein